METGVGSLKDIPGETGKAAQMQTQTVHPTLGMKIMNGELSTLGQRKTVRIGGLKTQHNGRTQTGTDLVITRLKELQLQINSQPYLQRRMTPIATDIPIIGQNWITVPIGVD